MSDSNHIRICCLPLAGTENPYQYLMMEGLRARDDLEVIRGSRGKFLAVLRTALLYRPDVIHFDWIPRYFQRRRLSWTRINAIVFVLEIWFVRRVLRRKLLWTVHNLGTHDIPFTATEAWVRRLFARHCDYVRVFHPSTVERASELLQIAEEKFLVVPEGSYIGYYPDTVSKSDARDWLGYGHEDFVLLYAGSIRPYKGIDDLIDSFDQIANDTWRLVLVGYVSDAEFAEQVHVLAEGHDRIDLHFRFVPENELQYFFKASDVVVLPFQSIENSGSAMLAMGFGRPVIAPSMGVLPERLGRQSEFLYQPGELSEALTRLHHVTPARLQTLGWTNLMEARSYSWEAFGDLVSELMVAEKVLPHQLTPRPSSSTAA